MSAEKFCLRWNDFEANISSAFRELREDKDFFDVTLACDDDQIQAHKVILSACSPFFRTVLRRNKHEHPLLYLKGVKYIDLVAVLNFMYHGEVNVAQEELNSFLAVAEDLKIKGLTQNGSNETTKSSDPTPTHNIRPRDNLERKEPIPPRRPRPMLPHPSSNLSYPDEDDIQEVVPVKSEPISLIPDLLPPQQISHNAMESTYSNPTSIVADPSMDNSSVYEDEYADYGNYEGAEGAYDSTMIAAGAATADGNKDPAAYLQLTSDPASLGPQVWLCLLCGKQSKQLDKGKRHVKFVHMKASEEVECPVCGKKFARKQVVDRHMKNVHREHFSM